MKWFKNRARFYVSCNYSCTIYLLVKIKEVNLKNLHTSACLNLNYGRYNKTETKNGQLHNPSPILLGKNKLKKKHCLGEMGNFLLPGVAIIRIWGRVLLGDMSKNKQIQLFNSQMYFPVILTPKI